MRTRSKVHLLVELYLRLQHSAYVELEIDTSLIVEVRDFRQQNVGDGVNLKSVHLRQIINSSRACLLLQRGCLSCRRIAQLFLLLQFAHGRLVHVNDIGHSGQHAFVGEECIEHRLKVRLRSCFVDVANRGEAGSGGAHRARHALVVCRVFLRHPYSIYDQLLEGDDSATGNDTGSVGGVPIGTFLLSPRL